MRVRIEGELIGQLTERGLVTTAYLLNWDCMVSVQRVVDLAVMDSAKERLLPVLLGLAEEGREEGRKEKVSV